MLLSTLIFICVYLFIATEKIDKTIASMLGAFAMIILGLISFSDAVAAIDFNVIFLLVGMMTCVFILSKTGFFEWLAIIIAKHAKGSPILILLFFLFLVGILSAFLDNVTTIILMAPVTILITQLLEISPVPFLILEAIASNIGGTATLIGDPPNILIGSQANLSFNDFIVNLGPIIVVIFIVFAITVYFLFRKQWNIPLSVKKRVTEAIPHLAIIDKKNMVKALIVMGAIFLGFFTHHLTHVEPGVIAMVGSIVMMMVCKADIDSTFVSVEWGVIFFFIGLFMIVAGLEHNGVIAALTQGVIKVAGMNLFLLCIVILIGSAVFSAILDNIPFVITMIPIIKKLIVQLALHQGITNPEVIQHQLAYPLWWSLALGACLGGNGTLIGASANIIVSKIGGKNKSPITFMHFSKYGFPFMVQSILICLIYIWIKFF